MVKRVLVIGGKREKIEPLIQGLEELGFKVQNSDESEAALHQLVAWKPHLVLADRDDLNEQAFSLASKIRVLRQDEYTPLCLLSLEFNLQDIERGLEAGVDDWLLYSSSLPELSLKLKTLFKLKEGQDALKRVHHRVEEVISTDELTGLMSMRAAYKRAEEEVAKARRQKKPVSVLLINLDHFSGVNQTYGFGVGSHVLQEVGLRLKKCLRSVDVLARIGADEFFVLLHETDLAGAEFVAERIRGMIQTEPFRSQTFNFNLTATVGVAGVDPELHTGQKMSDLLQLAMEALKSAKSNGQNRIEVYSFT